MNNRLVGLSLLLGAGACATGGVSTREQRRMLAPQNGPQAHVYASYTGGLTSRTVRASFRTESDAHVIVGRLSGDGSVEILFPATPRDADAVTAGKTYSVGPFRADYDGVPQIFNYASMTQRAYGAQLDSYDGRGNGFIFVIATQSPMFTDALDDHGQWADSLAVDDYYSTFDPRYAIRDLAQVLTHGMPYSLDYADAFSTQAFTGAAAAAMDCATLQSFGYYGYSGVSPCGGGCGWDSSPRFGWFGGFYPFIGTNFWVTPGFSQYSPYAGCGFAYDRFAAFGGYYRWGYYGNTWAYGPWDPPSVTRIRTATVYNYNGPVSPTASPAKSSPSTGSTGRTLGFTAGPSRPGSRGSENGFGMDTRHRFGGETSPRASTGSSWAPPIRPTHTSEDRPTRASRPSYDGGASRGSSPGRTEASRPSAADARPSTPAPSQPAPPPKVAATADAPRKP